MQGRQASFSYLNSFLQQRCHYLWSHFFQSEVPAGLWMIMGISVCAAGNRFARDVCTILSLFMTIWMFCCSQKHSYTLTRSGHVEISLDLKRKKRQKRKKQDRKKKSIHTTTTFPHWFNTNTIRVLKGIYTQWSEQWNYWSVKEGVFCQCGMNAGDGGLSLGTALVHLIMEMISLSHALQNFCKKQQNIRGT